MALFRVTHLGDVGMRYRIRTDVNCFADSHLTTRTIAHGANGEDRTHFK